MFWGPVVLLLNHPAVRSDAAQLEWPERSLDLILSQDVFEHVDAAALPALRN
jgi:hypothetical protein